MKNLSKILTWGSMVYGAIAFVLWILMVRADEGSEGGYINMMMYMTYIVFAAAVVITLVLSIMNVFTNKGKMKYMLKYIIGFAVIFVLSYVLANSDLKQVGEINITESASKWVGTGLYAFYFLIAGALIAIVYSGVKGIFSK
jgi:magnesium-transporting ATPase (P-type)